MGTGRERRSRTVLIIMSLLMTRDCLWVVVGVDGSDRRLAGTQASGRDAPTPGELSGRWVGEAAPDPALAGEVPVNPINWALVLVPEGGANSAFGGGYFDDSADVPGEPVRGS